MFIPNFFGTQEVRGPAYDFESQKDQLFSSSSTFQDGNIIGCVTPAVETDWAVTIVRQDAYLLVPIHLRSRRLLGFYLQGIYYQYQVLPFGLRDSPWVFSRLVAAVIA